MTPNPIAESLSNLVAILVVFGCGYVTVFACFALNNATDVFLDIRPFDKFFLCSQWGAGITSASVLLICAISKSVKFPVDIKSLLNLFSDNVFEILGLNCVFMVIHHRVLSRMVVRKIVSNRRNSEENT